MDALQRRPAMKRLGEEEWEQARLEMLGRWQMIIRKIEAHDEGGVLALANMMDEFCEVAVEERRAASGDRNDPAVPVLKFPPDIDVGGRCAFCRAFAQMGGCFGPLHALNKAVLDGHWTAARRVAEQHLEVLQGLRFTHSGEEIVH
jgi:hypothetical protein